MTGRRKAVAGGQLANPMNTMLIIVAVARFLIEQWATGFVVAFVVTFNVVMGSNEELKARARVEALAKLQVPRARVRRGGVDQEVESVGLVPGDVVLLEAGDVVPPMPESSPRRPSRCRRRRSRARARRTVVGLSFVAPLVVAVDKAVQLRRQGRSAPEPVGATRPASSAR